MTTFLRPTAHLIVLCAVVWVWMLSVGIAHAYTVEKIPEGDTPVGDFVVGPTKTELSLEPGTEHPLELLVTNRMGERRVFNLTTEDMKGSDDLTQNIVLLGDDRGPYSLKDYLKISDTRIELESGERARIPVIISIPKDAQPGGLYGSVLVSTAPQARPGESDGTGAQAGSVIVARIGSLFFITVPGDVKKEGNLVKFSTLPEGKKLFSRGPIDFQLLFKNTGSIHLDPYGTISIKNMFGEEVGLVNAEPWFAMPDSTRLRQIAWDRPYLFGYYTAEARINRGYDDQSDTAKVSFFVIPWTLIALVFVGLVLVFFVFRFIGRSFEIKRK